VAVGVVAGVILPVLAYDLASSAALKGFGRSPARVCLLCPRTSSHKRSPLDANPVAHFRDGVSR
jgi:hypothetical protein